MKSGSFKITLPLQTVESINESSVERQRRLEKFSTGREESDWRNRLIWGDKKYVLPSLLPEFAGKVDLIYIDPPFDTGADFSYTATVPDDPQDLEEDRLFFTRPANVIEQKAYRDTWGSGLDSYVKWFYETAAVLKELLSPLGSIYVHLDWHVGHYAKTVMDEVFGPKAFRSEIIWKRTTSHSDATAYGSVHDTLLFYAAPIVQRNQILQDYDPEYVDAYYRYKDENHDGRKFMSADLSGEGTGPSRVFGRRGEIRPPPGRHWMYDQEGIDKILAEDRIFWTRNGVPRLKKYLDESPGMPASDLWDDIQAIRSWHKEEATGYDTQKPEALLNRIILASSSPNSLVLDCFVGSGTTAVVAEKLGRRWIACDLGRFAIHTTRKRLLGVEGIRPFIIQNLGKYERQAWQSAEFGDDVSSRVNAYLNFIVRLYGAERLNGYVWLHGKKRNRFIHVGSVDSPVSPLDVGQIVAEFKRSIGSGKDAPKTNGIDVLGWDFAFELNEVAKQQSAQAGVDLRFLRIPREVLDKKAVEQGDIHFFELASLDLGLKVSGMKAKISIRDFVIPADDVPSDVQSKIKHWSQWIDYWAVDWDNRNDSFHNEWQEYRTRGKPRLETESSKTYSASGDYRVVVKIIDILGNDTTKMLAVKT